MRIVSEKSSVVSKQINHRGRKSTIVSEKSTFVGEKSTLMGEKSTIVDGNQPSWGEKSTIVDENQPSWVKNRRSRVKKNQPSWVEKSTMEGEKSNIVVEKSSILGGVEKSSGDKDVRDMQSLTVILRLTTPCLYVVRCALESLSKYTGLCDGQKL